MQQPGEDDDDLTLLLPNDVLADVLRRLAPRWLAASRCVRKAWSTVIDARRLLRVDLLPLSVAAILIDFNMYDFPEFFSRPSTGPAISGKLDYVPTVSGPGRTPLKIIAMVLLLYDSVVNPATRWAAPLPPYPIVSVMGKEANFTDKYLVFDPIVSPHYEVFIVPKFPPKRKPGEF